MPLVIYGLIFGSVAVAGLASYQAVRRRTQRHLTQRVEEARARLEDMFYEMSRPRLWLLHVAVPFGLGLAAWLMTGLWPMGLIGLGVGTIVPRMVIRQVANLRRERFHAQFIDGLLLLSSSLRAGLSMTQAFTVLAEEMPAPINQEFGLILKEIRMGVSVERAMAHFGRRMPSNDMKLFATGVLVARQTGGDVTMIFTRLVGTLRERRKIAERIKTLTFMARMQGMLMAILPFVFAGAVFTMDRSHLHFFLYDPTGRLLLGLVIVLQAIGGALFVRFSRSPYGR